MTEIGPRALYRSLPDALLVFCCPRRKIVLPSSSPHIPRSRRMLLLLPSFSHTKIPAVASERGRVGLYTYGMFSVIYRGVRVLGIRYGRESDIAIGGPLVAVEKAVPVQLLLLWQWRLI